MIPKLVFSFVFLSFISGNLFSQTSKITISGSGKEYAGQTLEFFMYRERIFDTEEVLAKTIVDKQGYFSVSFELSKTQLVFCNTALYKAYIYVEPGKSYSINLPPLATKTEENNNNPFFTAPLWHLLPIIDSTLASRDLNAVIYSFDQQYDPFLDKQILRYYDHERNRQHLDSFLIAINNQSQLKDNEYFIEYLNYKIACLEFMVKDFSQTELCNKYLKDKPARPDISSWWDFFNLYFDGYFGSLSLKKEFSGLYSLIGEGKYSQLDSLLKTDPALKNQQVREWVIIKEIYSGYYGNNLPLSTYLSLSDGLAANSKDSISISISRLLRNDVQSLLPGHSPPPSILSNLKGDTMSINLSGGKYEYLGFCSLHNLECQQEFEYLKYFYHKHGKYLNIVIVIPETEKDLIPGFTEENSIPWDFWFSTNGKKTLKDYKIRSYPVFYLFDREGKILMSPATLPSAGFEQQLFKILKSRSEI